MTTIEAKFLTEKDAELLQRVIDKVRKTPGGLGKSGEETVWGGLETYIAIVPVAGIPGLTIGDPDEPGSAVCSIYRIADNAATGTDDPDYVMEAISGMTRRVFNISTSDITTRYAVVVQLGNGKFVATSGVGVADETGTGTTGTGTTGTGTTGTGTTGTGTTGTGTTGTGATGTGTTGTGATGTGSPSCDDQFADVPSGTPAYVLGLDSSGCLIKVPVSEC